MRRTMWGVAHGRIGHLARHRRGGRQGSASVNSSDTGGNFNHRVSDIDALTAARHRRTDFRDECHGTTIASFASKTTIATNDLLGPAILTPADNDVLSVNADSSLTVQDSFAQAATHRAAQFPTPSATAPVARSPRRRSLRHPSDHTVRQLRGASASNTLSDQLASATVPASSVVAVATGTNASLTVSSSSRLTTVDDPRKLWTCADSRTDHDAYGTPVTRRAR